MKATGVVRRIDELGRIVIPKEVRRTFRMKEGTPLELYIGDDGEIILKKYSPLVELSDYAEEAAETIFSVLSLPVVITDNDKVIAAVGINKSAVINSTITQSLEHLMDKRTVTICSKNERMISPLFEHDSNQNSYAVAPMIANSDVCGAIILFAKDTMQISESELNVLKTLSLFLSKQID